MNGSKETERRLTESELRELFPLFTREEFIDTSDPIKVYNCIAWAANQNSVWWEPAAGPGYYWPPGVPFDYKPSTLPFAFAALGYERCETFDVEEGFEKVALYADADEWTHAARQKSDGKWTSKLNIYQYIEHPSPDSVVCETYCNPFCFMRMIHTAEMADTALRAETSDLHP